MINELLPKNIKHPEDLNAVLWRYTSFSKFVSMLDTKSLYFSSLSSLGDPFEGSQTYPDYAKEEEDLYEAGLDSGIASGLYISESRSLIDSYSRNHVFVNCWHMNESESAAMWQIYADRGKGIAIKTIFSRLSNLLPNKVSIGMVDYVNYQTDSQEGKYFCLCKRKEFEHEKEIRAFLVDGRKTIKDGFNLRINLQSLIDEIVIAPQADDWLVNLVQNVSEKYGLRKQVRKSAIVLSPIFPWTKKT